MSSASGNFMGYSVEARSTYYKPEKIGELLLDKRWRQIHWSDDRGGMPEGPSYQQPWLRSHGLFSYQAAQALRWWFLAEVEANGRHFCIETRLVEHKVTYSTKAEEGRALDKIGKDGREDK